jgi:hypothetical protein
MQYIPCFCILLNNISLGFYHVNGLVLLLNKNTHLRKSSHLPYMEMRLSTNIIEQLCKLAKGSLYALDIFKSLLNFTVRCSRFTVPIRIHELKFPVRKRMLYSRENNYSLTKYLATLFIVNDSPDFLWCGIGFHLSRKSVNSIARSSKHMPILNCLSILCLYFVRYCCSTV